MDDLLLASLIDHARSVPVWSSFPGLAIAPATLQARHVSLLVHYIWRSGRGRTPG